MIQLDRITGKWKSYFRMKIKIVTVGFVMNEDSLSLHPSKTPVTLLP